MSDKKLSLLEHINELRARIIKSIICLFFCSVLVYSFVDTLLQILVKPVGKLVFISPSEAFVANIKISFFAGLFLSSPFMLYQIWQFISTGLKPKEKRYALFFWPLSFIFFVLGCLFGYFIIVPIGIKFLLSFATEFLSPMLSIDRYISFMGMLVLTFGLIFQLPLVSLFLTKIGLINTRFLSQRRRHAVVFIFILAAILTPPDVITQCLMAIPLLILYEIGIIFSKFASKPL